MAVYISTVLDEYILLNTDFFNKESLIEIDINEQNEQKITIDKNKIQNHFGITINNLYSFDYNKEVIINIELLFYDNIIGNLKYFDGEKYIIDNSQIIENKILKANIYLKCWNKKCRFFIDNLNIDKFIIRKFKIKDLNNNTLFTQELWSPKIKNHYSLVKGNFLYNELTKILYKTDVFMIINNKYKINYNLPNIKYYHLDNINTKSKILYLFIVNSEYYNNLISNKFLKESIETNLIKTIFRSCKIPEDFKYNNGLFFIQSKNMYVPKSFQTILNSKENTVNSCIQREKELNLKNRIYVNTMGVSSNLKYYNNSYNDNKIHILFIGRLIRPFNLIKYINNIDNLLDHKKYVIDILPGTFELNGKKLNPSNIENFNIIKSFFNKTINLLPCVPQDKVYEYILKSDIAIDFPMKINILSINGPENSKLYEYISGGLPTVSQITPNSYFINKYNCGIEINKISNPKEYYNAIIEISNNLKKYNRENISKKFIEEYSYKNLTYKLIRNIFMYYKEIPLELLGDWNYTIEHILNDTPYLNNHKFLIRDRTIKSNWDRLLKYFPDLFADEKKKFLDLSCGNGATLEILRFLGHTPFGVDYESKNHCFDKPLFHSKLEMNNKWPYKILLESQNLNFKGHDLNVLPYPFDDNSFDIINCWGAIEFYGRPKYWKVFILEMLRISKEYVNIAFNNISSWLKDNEEYIQEYNTFFNEIETQFSDYNIVIEKVTDRHYKFYKKQDITDIVIKKSINDVIKVPKINIVILIDVYEWAYHYDALDMKKCLEDFSDVSVHIMLFDDFYSDRNNYNNYDLVYVLCAYKLKDIEYSNIVVSKTNIFITSHYSYKIINNILSKCKYCFVVNGSISSEFNMHADSKNINKIYLYKNFWNNNIFYKKKKPKKDKLTIGFCGKENEHKGYHIYEELKKNNSFNFFEATDKKKIDYQDMNDFYNNIDILLSISLDEGNPNPAFESALTGTLQLVSCKKSYIYENIINDHNGCIVERNIESITNRLNYLNENKDIFKKMKQKSYDYFNNNLSIGSSYEYFLKTTNDILKDNMQKNNIQNKDILVDKELNNINSILIYKPEFFKTDLKDNCLIANYINNECIDYSSSGFHFKIKNSLVSDFENNIFSFDIYCDKPIKLKIYTGIKWIKIDETIKLNQFNNIKIKNQFRFNTSSKYRIGFENIENNAILKIKDLDFKKEI